MHMPLPSIGSHKVRAGLLAVMVMVGLADASIAETGRLTWTSFLYAGPGSNYAVIDELPQASRFDVESCSEGWCRITLGGVEGYLRSEVVRPESGAGTAAGLLPNPASGSPQAKKGDCFEAVQTGGNGGHLPITICAR